MISTELLVVMLIFLAYIGVWYAYMNDFMGVAEKGMENIKMMNYADVVAHNINVVCINAGAVKVELQENVSIVGNGDAVAVEGIERKVECPASGEVNSDSVNIKKDGDGVRIF